MIQMILFSASAIALSESKSSQQSSKSKVELTPRLKEQKALEATTLL